MVVEAQTRRFTVDDYHTMVQAGILSERDRVELVNGEVVDMSPIGSLHAECVARLSKILFEAAGDEATVWIQNPVQLGEFAEPQPDAALLRSRAEGYWHRLPRAEDIHLLIEVSDSTLRYDTNDKMPLYASQGVAEAWIVDLNNRIVRRFSEPVAGSYRTVTEAGTGETMASTVFPRLDFRVDDLLPS